MGIYMYDNIAVNSFFSYARLGLERQQLSNIEMYKRIIVCCSRCSDRNNGDEMETVKRLFAVYDTLRLLNYAGRKDELRAIYAIYFATHGRKPRKNEIHLRALHHAFERNCDIRTVYRRLNYSKRLFNSIYSFKNTECP